MVKKTIFSSEEHKSVAEIGEFLILIGEKLKNEGSFNLAKGTEQLQVKPEGSTKLEMKYEVENEIKHKFEVEIEWKPGKAQGEEVSIS